ncbi:MAG: hypothetical protein OXQ28_06900 [Acidobacteriota bacterium]|nr:hypothetical protein [Acidobacteriota bacterium]
MSKVRDLHQKWSRNPDYRRAYDDLDLQFALARSLMEARVGTGLTPAQLTERMETTQSVVARLGSGRWHPYHQERRMEWLQKFWQRWVYDSTRLPVEWKNHPHQVFKVVARLGCVCLGSIVPFGLAFIQSGIPRRLDEGTMQLGWVFVSVMLVGFVIWLISVIAATASEQKSLLNYIFIGSIGPAHLTVVALLLQLVQ